MWSDSVCLILEASTLCKFKCRLLCTFILYICKYVHTDRNQLTKVEEKCCFLNNEIVNLEAVFNPCFITFQIDAQPKLRMPPTESIYIF